MFCRLPSFPILLLSVYVAAVMAAETTETSAYEALRSHGLPMGLLPKGVKDFRLEEGGGRFEALLEAPCTARLESGIRYERNVSGRLTFGEIAFLSGISAQDLFLWFPVRDIRVDVPASGLIYFDVGVVQKQLPLSLFESPPDCRPDDDDAITGLLEGARIVHLLSKSNSGKLRYDLDEASQSISVL